MLPSFPVEVGRILFKCWGHSGDWFILLIWGPLSVLSIVLFVHVVVKLLEVLLWPIVDFSGQD